MSRSNWQTIAVLTGVTIFIASLGAAPRSATADDGEGKGMPDGVAVFKKFVETIGGEGAIETIESFHVTGKYALPSLNLIGTLDLYYSKPDRLLFHIDIPGFGVVAQGYDGRTGWAMDPQQGSVILTGDRLSDIRKQAARGFSILPRIETYRSIEGGEIVEFNGRKCRQLRLVSRQAKGEIVEYYDAEDGLLVGRTEMIHTALGEAEMKGRVGGYKTFGSLRIATEWSHQAAGQEWSATYETFEANKVNDSIFALPDEIVAKLRG